METTKTLNANEAPAGFYAVLKSDASTPKLGNICRACDWRKECNDGDTDFSIGAHRCMDHAVWHTKAGREVRRQDGCSVVFKKATQ